MAISQTTQDIITAHSSVDYAAVLSHIDSQVNQFDTQLDQLATEHANVEAQRADLLADRDQVAALAASTNG